MASAILGTYITSSLVYGDTLHAARSRVSAVPRRADGEGGLYPQTHLCGSIRFHGLALGVQRENIPVERGRRHLRRTGRARVQLLGKNTLNEMSLATPWSSARVYACEPNRPIQHRQDATVIRAMCCVALTLSILADVSAQTMSFSRVSVIPGAADIVEVHGRLAYIAAGETLTMSMCPIQPLLENGGPTHSRTGIGDARLVTTSCTSPWTF